MGTQEVLENALQLKPQDRLVLVDLLLESVDRPDPTIDDIWLEEAQRRLVAYREGKMKTISMEELFGA